jgi:hypothetical protein
VVIPYVVTGYLRIGGAIISAALIVLGAFLLSRNDVGVQTAASLQATEGRSYIEPVDSDGDGTPDWEENALRRIYDTLPSPTTTATDIATYEKPTTFTGRFSEAFFQDYLSGKVSGADLSDPTDIVNKAVETIEANTGTNFYNRLDITVIPDSDFAFREYGNTIGKIIVEDSAPKGTGKEMVILQRALETNDETLLAGLDPIHTAYTNYVLHTLETPVPESFATEHLALVNTYQSILDDVSAMRGVFTDPLLGLARVNRYQNNASGLYYALQNIIIKLTERGVVYATDEPGAILYLVRN